ncbi:MAG: hypothetical protein IJ779_00805 [Ruminococcus sp.]|nr:hypothetical protein [Ruminococcus sp.]
MLPKKNIGAITIMSAFLGLTLTHICTAFVYYSYSRSGGASDNISTVVGAVGIIELLLILALTVGAALLFVYSDDGHSMGILGTSALLSIMSLAVRSADVRNSDTVFTAVTIAMNLAILGVFAVYALFYYKREMKNMAVIAAVSGLWVSFLSVGCRAAASRLSGQQAYFTVLAVIALISAVCYFAAFFSQRQSFE